MPSAPSQLRRGDTCSVNLGKSRESHFEGPHPSRYATNMHTEPMHIEELEVIPEQQTECIISTVHPDNLQRSLVTVCAVQTHNEISQLCSLATSVESKPLPKIPIVNTSLKRTCSTQRPTTSHQAHEVTASSPNLDQHQLRPCGSAYLGLHQFTPPNKHRLCEAGRGLKACHAFMPRHHATRSRV